MHKQQERHFSVLAVIELKISEAECSTDRELMSAQLHFQNAQVTVLLPSSLFFKRSKQREVVECSSEYLASQKDSVYALHEPEHSGWIWQALITAESDFVLHCSEQLRQTISGNRLLRQKES